MSRRKEYSNEKIIHDEYFGKQPSAAFLLTARLVLLCVMTGSLILVFCGLYGYEGNAYIPAGIAALAAGVIYILASVLPAPIIYGAVMTAIIAVVWVLRDTALRLGQYFWDYLMVRIDGRIIQTAGFTFHEFARLKANAEPEHGLMQTSYFWAAMLIGVLCALLFAAAVRTRIHLSVPITAAVIITAPAVAGEIAGFLPEYLVFVVCIFGFEAISSSYELDSRFIYGSLSNAHLYNHRSDREYSSRLVFAPPSRKIAGDTVRYHRYSGNMIAAAAAAAIVFFAAAKIIPEGMGLNYQKVLDTAVSIGNSAADAVGDLLGMPIGSPDDKGYFSSDSYGDISDSISIVPPGDSDRAVLEVTLGRNDIPVYLRGDIGVDYNGSSWSSVRLTDEEYRTAIPVGFAPEAEYQVFRQFLARGSVDFDPDEVMPLQSVSVKYLRNTRVVFQPVAPFDLNYRGSSQYDCFGDFILRTKRGSVNKYEGLALTPCMDSGVFGSYISDIAAYSQHSAVSDGSITAPDMTPIDYIRGISAYRGFIEKTYKYNSDAFRTSGSYNAVSGFMADFERFYKESGYYAVENTPDEDTDGSITNSQRYYRAKAICEYFSENFTYSLDDTNNGENMLDTFLNETKSGHCALFATAMTLALREYGIPARYVTGYVIYGGGEPDKNGNYKYTLTEKQLHAWVEVYFRGIGWLPFDPTATVPGYAEIVYETPPIAAETSVTDTSEPPSTTAAGDPDSPDSPESTDAETTAEPDNDPLSQDGGDNGEQPDTVIPVPETRSGNDFGSIIVSLLPIIVIVAVAAALIAIIALFFRNLRKAEKKTINSFRTLPPYEASQIMYRFVMRLLETKGLVPGAEQFYDFAERVDGSIEMKGANVFMMDVMPVFEKCEFGSPEISPVSEDERNSVYAFTAAVYRKVIEDCTAIKRIFLKISLFL
ncbi:MAG: transglutaminase domain-containing protein [Ruminiclostridium sp.]|nr:transglutaminase domain-containing protein [Ruminiclostridium sp.]